MELVVITNKNNITLQAEVYFEATRFRIARVITGNVRERHRAVGAMIMHGFGSNLVRNPEIWFGENQK